MFKKTSLFSTFTVNMVATTKGEKKVVIKIPYFLTS
jgi:hypothetical protein